MKKIIFLTLLIPLCISTVFAQSPGFKIYNKTSIIKSDASKGTQVSIVRTNGSSEKVYKTPQIARYNILYRENKMLKDTVEALNNELFNNSISTQTDSLFTDQEVLEREQKIKTIKEEIERNNSSLDSLFYVYTKERINFEGASFFPGVVASQAFFDISSGNTGRTLRALGNTGINIGSNTASIYSELVSGTLAFFKVSLGAMLTRSSNSDSAKSQQAEAYQRLVSNGGNTVLNLEYPMLYAHTKNNQANLIMTLNAKGAADLPSFGTDTSKWAGSASFGLNVFGDISTKKNELTFFANLYIGGYFGTDVFRTNLGVDKNDFSFGQLSAGLVFLNNFKLSFILTSFSSEALLRNRSVIAGGQVLK